MTIFVQEWRDTQETEVMTMAEETMLQKVKRALKLTTEQYDQELTDMIEEAKADLGLTGNLKAKADDEGDALIRRAIITYCRIHHGSPEDYDRLVESYREQKGQMRIATGYTDWGLGE